MDVLDRIDPMKKNKMNETNKNGSKYIEKI